MIEQFTLERASDGCMVHLAPQSGTELTKVFSVLSSLVVNISEDGGTTVSLGKLFQCMNDDAKEELVVILIANQN